MAFDHGHPMKIAFVNVTVVLIDVNDNAPLCAESSLKVTKSAEFQSEI